jgi:PAS domain-containing protein
MKACHPEDAPASLAAWCVAAEERRQLDIQIRLRRWDGAWRWHLGRLFPMLDENGEIAEWFGAFTDLHEQKSEQLSPSTPRQANRGRNQRNHHRSDSGR